MRTIFLSAILFFSLLESKGMHPEEEIPAIRKVIEQMFEGMRKGDSSLVSAVFMPEAKLFSVGKSKGITKVREEKISEFISAVGTPHDKVWDEQLISWKFTIDGDLAIVTTDYIFFLGKTFSHCGMNVFQVIHTGKEWKIFQITDTRRTDCLEDPVTANIMQPKPTELRLNNLMDNWHRAAARGDLKTFSELMDVEFIYLGTDKTERWNKESFVTFCKPYFEREQGAWNFKPLSRKLYFSDDYRFAWFEEHLDTWMGITRGSGVFHYTSQGWKLKHYNLAVTIDNDKMNKVIEVTK
jgi:hypothetical protein